jgi:NTP pyrophosphatase (non-canonical NTP hydrolase)
MILYEVIGEAATLEQLAEECVELAHASLKLARHLRGDNKVYNTNEDDMIKNIIEEIVDVNIIYNEVLGVLEEKGVDIKTEFSRVYLQKMERMKKRLSEAGD